MSDHECDIDDNEPAYVLSIESLSVLDLAGIAAQSIGGCFQAIGQGLHVVGNVMYSGARYRRYIKEQDRARREAGFELERIVEGP